MLGVALLPFIDEKRLFNTLKKVYPDLTTSEIERNQLGENLIFISKLNKEATEILSKQLKEKSGKFDCCKDQMHGMKGKLSKSERFTDQMTNAICLEYYDPEYEKGFIFQARRLREAILPERVLKPEDFKNNRQYNNYNNYNDNQQQRQNNQYYKPVIGFQRRNDQASISNAGHRTIDFYNRPNYSNNNNFNNSNYQQRNYQQNYNSQYNYNQQQNYRTNYQQQNYQISNQYNSSISQQYINQLNYSRRDELTTNQLNPQAQNFIPSYNQVPSSNQVQSSNQQQQQQQSFRLNQQSNYNRQDKNYQNNRYRR